MVIGMGREGRAKPLTDLGQRGPAIGAAPQVNAADNHCIGVGRVHPDDVVIPALAAQEGIARVHLGVGLAAIGAFVDFAAVDLHRGIDNARIAAGVGYFDATCRS